MRVCFIRSEPVAHNISTYYFLPDKPLQYIAGQFIELHIPHEHQDDRGDNRWFTLSSAPSDDLVAITTSITPGAMSSFKRALLQLNDSSEVTMSAPMGDFVLPKDTSIPLLFVCGGIGVTPFHSILDDLRIKNERRNITLLYGARHYEDVAFQSTFKEMLGDNFKITLTQPANLWNGLYGAITSQLVMSLYTSDHYVYMSGPEPMVEQLYKTLKTDGANKRHLFTDYFLGYPE